MLQNTRFTASTVSELLKNLTEKEGYTPHPN